MEIGVNILPSSLKLKNCINCLQSIIVFFIFMKPELVNNKIIMIFPGNRFQKTMIYLSLILNLINIGTYDVFFDMNYNII